MKWRNIISMFCIVALLCCMLGGCGSSSTESEETSTSAEELEEEESVSTSEAQEEAVTATTSDEEASNSSSEESTQTAVEKQIISDGAAALIAEAAETAGAVPADQVADEDKTDTWLFVESEEYQEQMNSIRAGVDEQFPTSQTEYDENGKIVSVKGVTYDYPMEGEHSLSALVTMRGFVPRYVEDFADFITMQIAQEETNIQVEFLTMTEDQMSTQMSLMFVSGDYTDIVTDFNYSYTGTAVSALSDDLIISLTDYLPEYSPNYWAWLNADENTLKNASDDNGEILEYYELDPVTAVVEGNWIRSDLLESFGMDTPVTISDYESYLEACVNAGLSSPIGANIISWFGVAASAYNLPSMINVSGEFDAAYSLYHIGDEVHSALESDSQLRDYVTLMHEWYEQGYFLDDIISLGNGTDSRGKSDDLIYGGEVGFIMGGMETSNQFVSKRTDDTYTIEPSHAMVFEEGDVLHFGSNELSSSGTGSTVITTACEDIEAACRFMDWFYTDMGIETMNYGPEGLTWNWSEDGTTREFTSALYNDIIYDLDPSSVLMVWTGTSTWVTINDPYNTLYYQPDTSIVDALDIWTKDVDNEYYLTSCLALTTEETELISGALADINTLISEYLAKFLVGDLDIDENWDTFEDSLYQLGLQDIVDTYQDAYDRYLLR